jgi:hypothetical protein
MTLLQPRVRKSETRKHHPHTRDAPHKESEHLKPQMIPMSCGCNQEKGNGNHQQYPGLIRPSDKSIEIAAHTGTYIEKEEESPQRNTHKSHHIDYIFLSASSRKMNRIIKSGTAKSRQSNSQSHQRLP